MDGITSLFVGWGTLAGFAALVTVIINILKIFGVVKDDTAANWSAGLNLLGLIVMMVIKIVNPTVDIGITDAYVANIAIILQVVCAYLVQVGASKLFHSIIKGIPLIGKSFTVDRMRGK